MKLKLTQDQVRELYLLLEEYIEENQFPTLAEFLTQGNIRHKYKLTSQYVYDHPELFEYHLSVMTSKCEAYLIKRGLSGIAIPMTIFMLKQLKYGGYADQQQIDLTSKSQPIKFVNSVPRPRVEKTK